MRLTERQFEICQFIDTERILLGRPPSMYELAAAFGVKPNTMQKYLERLRAKGAITWERGKRRTYRVLGPHTIKGEAA